MRIIEVIGNSMEPSLKKGQFVFTKGITFPIRRNQIVLLNHDDTLLIKRVIGLPGETIRIEGGKIIVDDKVWKTYPSKKNYIWVLNANKFVVLGDNVSNSWDSRKFGEIDASNLLERIILKLLPFGRVT